MLGLIVAYSRVMSSIKKWGRKYQDSLLNPPAKFLHQHRVSPSIVSIISMFMVFVSSILLFQKNKYYLITLPMAICLDMFDGTLARMGVHPKNKFGVLFDFFLDRFSDSMIILALAVSGMLGYYFTLSLLFFYVLSTLLVKLLESLKINIYILSFRTITVFALFLQEVYAKALFFICSILLINYFITALSALPKVVFKPK